MQTLLAHDLVDALWLRIHPITLGRGKRLFVGGRGRDRKLLRPRRRYGAWVQGSRSATPVAWKSAVLRVTTVSLCT